MLNRRTRFLIASLLPCFIGGCAEKTKTLELRPARHLLLISIDALRADRIGCYGGRAGVSPNIDALAAAGVRVEEAHSPTGMTLPSVVSLMTSKYPDEHGVTFNQLRAEPEEKLLSERLKEIGFKTRALVANGVLAPQYSGLAQGYDQPKQDFQRVEDEDRMTKMAERIIRTDFGGGEREFLWLHYMAPHAPYTPPQEIVDRFDPDYAGTIDGTSESLDPVFVEKKVLSAADRARVDALYDAELNHIDAMIGRVLERLAESEHAADTLVVLTADHGEELYDRNCYFYHANSLYRSVTHVPVIFRYPEVIPDGKVVGGLAELIDVVPTILDYLAVPYGADGPATRLRGESLVRAIDKGRTTKSFTYGQILSQAYLTRNERWSYVSNPTGFEPKSVPEEGSYPIALKELYDLKADPNERLNVADQHPDVVEQMERQLASWSLRLKRDRPNIGYTVSPEREAELRALGYLSPATDGR